MRVDSLLHARMADTENGIITLSGFLSNHNLAHRNDFVFDSENCEENIIEVGELCASLSFQTCFGIGSRSSDK